MRLDKYISVAAQISRADARVAIRRGAASIDGIVVKKADAPVSATAQIVYHGKPVQLETFVYIMLDKPLGVISVSEGKGETTVVDLVRKDYPRRELFPAGRLDKASTGFVLITDNGAFAHAILTPKHHVAKTYEVVLDTPLTQEMVDGFANGVTLADGGKMAAAQVFANANDAYGATVILTQGVYHQVKRMFGVFDAGVNALRRVNIGGVPLDCTLGDGHYRALTKEELSKICTAAGLNFQEIDT